MTTITEYLAEQKRLAEDGQADSTSLKMNTDTGRWMISSSKRTIFAMDQLVDTVPRMIAALEAVAALHLPLDTRSQYPMPPDWQPVDLRVCSHCKLPGAGDALHPWPCPTIRAIEAALGGEGDGN